MLFENTPSHHIKDAYKRLVLELDTAVASITRDRFQNRLHCGPGCASCCIKFSVLPLEAALIERCYKAHVNISVNVNQGTTGRVGVCRFLKGDLCTIYECRPIICRTQGLPLGYIDELAGSIEVSACELNFPADMALEFEDLLLMDEFNGRLAALNIEYCQEANLDPEQRIELEDLLKG